MISISEEILKDDDVELPTISLNFGVDEECQGFNLQEYLGQACQLLNINPDDITVKQIQNGSTIITTELNDKLQGKEKKLKIKMIYDLLTDKLQAELAKLKTFFMYMGPIQSFFKKQKFREEIRLRPEFNHIYCIDQTYWSGVLHDGKDRGGKPYYCPVGWKRYSFYIADNFDEKFKGWCICYHGTKFTYGLSILLSGLKPAKANEHGDGIYATPSINYAAHPRYSEVKVIDTKHQKKFFQNGKYVQFVLECRVHPKNFKVEKETLDGQNTTIDENIDNNELEWIIDNKKKTLVDFNDPDSTIVCSGLMIRVTDNHPGLLPQSRWWQEAHICNNKNCCCLGIELADLKKQIHYGKDCNIIYD